MKKDFGLCLAIETSCDDTSVAVVDSKHFVRAVVGQNQDTVHDPYGGIIPELACRNHTMRILPLVDQALKTAAVSWKDIRGIAVTSKPGLIGALLVGVTVAKTLSLIHRLSLVGVNHLEGHLHAPFLKDNDYHGPDLQYPFVALCVSGGHTSLYHAHKFGQYELLGRTIDDAAGEAFDKFGKLLGLGYPAGAKVDQLAKKGDRTLYAFPRALMKKEDLNFSFSGLKTAGSLKIKELKGSPDFHSVLISEDMTANLCASYQEAIMDVLVEKSLRALQKTKIKTLVVTGGVSANSRLRQRIQEDLVSQGIEVFIPPPRFCTDNAAMIGLVGIEKLRRGKKDSLRLSPEAFMKVAELS